MAAIGPSALHYYKIRIVLDSRLQTEPFPRDQALDLNVHISLGKSKDAYTGLWDKVNTMAASHRRLH